MPGLSINTNITALLARRQMGIAGTRMTKALERLSSGLRINRAEDDAAGLTIAENLRSQVVGLDRAISNAQDGVSLIQTAEGALSEDTSILQRIRELAVQAANGTLTSIDRLAIQNEVSQLVDEIDRIAETTEFNSIKLLNGNVGAEGVEFQAVQGMQLRTHGVSSGASWLSSSGSATVVSCGT